MKIGIVCYPTYGGSGVVATELGLALARNGHEVHFITYKRPVRLSGSFQESVYYHEVDSEDYPLFEFPPYDTALASKVVDVVLYQRLDILHVHYAIPHSTVAYLAKKVLIKRGIYIPVVTTLHGTDITLVGSHPAFAPMVEFGINKSDGVTTVSHSLKEDTLKHFQVDRPIQVIHNFIDFGRFRRTNKQHFKQLFAPKGEYVLTHISNFRRVKRVQDVIQIFHQIKKVVPSKLLMIGDGPDRAGAESLCRELGICDDVRFIGKQDAVEELLAISDLFLMPSETESFGLSALEAMACEVPVISSDGGGLPELNLHGVTGYLAPAGEVATMAQYALDLLMHPEKLAQFKAQALQHARTFDIEHILPKYEAYYAEVLAGSAMRVE